MRAFVGAWIGSWLEKGSGSRPASERCSPWLLPAGRRLAEIGISTPLSAQHGKVEIGTEILLRIGIKRFHGRNLHSKRLMPRHSVKPGERSSLRPLVRKARSAYAATATLWKVEFTTSPV
jgi:hypothetical protein